MPIPLKVRYPEQSARQTLIERLIRLGLPYLPAEDANNKIVELMIENMKLKAALDAHNFKGEKEENG